MSEQRTDRIVSLADLRPTDWQRLLEITDRFEKAWPNPPTPNDEVDLTAFLPPPEDSLRPVVFQELVKTDLEIRWRRGQHLTLEKYVERYPELGDLSVLPAKLIYEEYRVRQLYGDRPDSASYESRFPKQFAGLQQLIADQPPPTLTNLAATPSSSDRSDEPTARQPAQSLRITAVGDNKIIQRIGSGGFGEVYRAEAPGGVEVAIKVIYRPLDHEEAQRELQSLELVKGIRHPYLLQTQRFSQQEDRLYIVMELADRSLRDRLRECRQQGLTGIPIEELLRYFREAAEAIDFLHGHKVLHRDIKPENILLVGRHVKVADFGLARLQQSQRSATASGSGTPAYMAPEVWRGKVSLHSDQYSLAVAYVEMRIDRRPFAGGDMMELMLSHVQNKPDLAPLPEHEREVVFRAMEKDPAQRYGSCQEFVHALEQAIVKDGGAPIAGNTAFITPAMPTGSPAEAHTGREGSDGGGSTVFGTSESGDNLATLRDRGVAAPSRPEPGTKTEIEPWKAARTATPPPSVAGPASPPKRSKAPLALVVFVLIAAGTVGALFLVRGSKHGGGASGGSFALERPETLHVRAGDQGQVTFVIARDGFDGPVKIASAKSSAKVKEFSGSIPAGASSVPIDISVESDAAPGKYEVPIQAVGSGVKQDGTLQLVVEAPNVYLPTTLKEFGHWQALPGKPPLDYKDRLFNWEIEFVFKDEKVKVPFVLIPPGDDDLPPFYISKFKISNGAYERFFATKAKQLNLTADWKAGAAVGTGSTGIDRRDDYPVFGVHAEEAYLFAQWLGGDLPTPKEWDKAAGAHRDARNRGDGPFKGPWQKNAKEPEVAVNRGAEGPLPNGAATKDYSYYGVQDMAGNGLEWTRKVQGSTTVDFLPLPRELRKEQILVILRSRSYQDPDPLQFTNLTTDLDTGGKPYLVSAQDTSFRVVLEPTRSPSE
jgi:serine/threonine protein kinase